MLESTFFPGARRELLLADYKPLKTRANEKRKRLTIESPLNGDNVVGLPEWIHEAYLLLAKDKVHADVVKLEKFELAAMTVEIYHTDKTKKRALLLTNCTLNAFSVGKRGAEDKATFYFRFTVYSPDSMELHEWLRDHYAMRFFAKFDPEQGEIGEVKKPEQPRLVSVEDDVADLQRADASLAGEDYMDPKYDKDFESRPRA